MYMLFLVQIKDEKNLLLSFYVYSSFVLKILVPNDINIMTNFFYIIQPSTHLSI